MIGNDVVDLALAKTQSNWKRKGYLDKIFTSLEKEFILESTNPHEIVWQLWSRKEAVYKILLQKGEKRGYFPTKIECLDCDHKIGIVRFENQKYFTKTSVENDLVHSIAVEKQNDFDLIIETTTSKSLKKINGIPYYEVNSKLFSASKSHHGQFQKIVYLS